MAVAVAMTVTVTMAMTVTVAMAVALGCGLRGEDRLDSRHSRQGEAHRDHALQERTPVAVIRDEVRRMLVHAPDATKLAGARSIPALQAAVAR